MMFWCPCNTWQMFCAVYSLFRVVGVIMFTMVLYLSVNCQLPADMFYSRFLQILTSKTSNCTFNLKDKGTVHVVFFGICFGYSMCKFRDISLIDLTTTTCCHDRNLLFQDILILNKPHFNAFHL